MAQVRPHTVVEERIDRPRHSAKVSRFNLLREDKLIHEHVVPPGIQTDDNGIGRNVESKLVIIFPLFLSL